MNLRKILFFLLALITLIAAVLTVFRVPLSIAATRHFATARLAEDALEKLPDGLHVGLCGAGSPFQDDIRSGPCTLVIAGKHMFVFDAGSGAARNIGKMGFIHGNIDGIFFTHFHSDHIDGLGELLLQRWVTTANREPVRLYGPTGVDKVVDGFMLAYSQDHAYRVAHHGDATVPASGFGARAITFAPTDEGVVVLKNEDLEIDAFNVNHGPVHPAVGYRIRYKGRSLVLSGDTSKSPNLQRAAQGVDLLVHEAISPVLMDAMQQAAANAGRPNLQKIFSDVLNYHTTPEQAAEIARDAGVHYLLLNHITPALPLPGMARAFIGSAEQVFDGPVRIGRDGDFISLLAGSKEIEVNRRF